MSLDNRKRCLWDLKGSDIRPDGVYGWFSFQTNETIAEDLLFINELKPEMVGIGPFIHIAIPFSPMKRRGLWN